MLNFYLIRSYFEWKKELTDTELDELEKLWEQAWENDQIMNKEDDIPQQSDEILLPHGNNQRTVEMDLFYGTSANMDECHPTEQ